jgi:hypothetical protein
MGKADKLLEQAAPHLEAGEVIRAAVMGAYETKIMGSDTVRNGVLIATDRRVVFYAKKLGGFDLESFPFGNISSFEHGKSMMGHNIAFHASGNAVQVKWLQPATEFAAFLDVVKEAMNAKHLVARSEPAAPATTAPSSDVFELLKQLGALRDAGVISTDDFEAKKAELLARI